MNKKATFSCVKDYDEQGEHLTPSHWVIKNQPFQSSQVSPFPSAQTINMPFSIIMIAELHGTHSTRLRPHKP